MQEELAEAYRVKVCSSSSLHCCLFLHFILFLLMIVSLKFQSQLADLYGAELSKVYSLTCTTGRSVLKNVVTGADQYDLFSSK